jgi:hypothetical protein
MNTYTQTLLDLACQRASNMLGGPTIFKVRRQFTTLWTDARYNTIAAWADRIVANVPAPRLIAKLDLVNALLHRESIDFEWPWDDADTIQFVAWGLATLRYLNRPIALTKAQVARYNLPPLPFAKPQAAARAANLGDFDDHAVELDALEAIHPGELARIITSAIMRYYDPDLLAAVEEQKSNLIIDILWARALALIPHANKLARLQDEFDQAIADFNDAIAPIADQLPALLRQVQNALLDVDQIVDVDDYPLPEPKKPNPIQNPLFQSDRSYLDQLAVYKAYRAGDQNSSQSAPSPHPRSQERTNEL